MSARLRNLLAAELRRGMVELGESRTGYGTPIGVAVGGDGGRGAGGAADLARAARRSRRGGGALRRARVRGRGARGGGRFAAARRARARTSRCGSASWAGCWRFAYPAADPAEAAEYAHEALTAEFEERRIDRLRARSHLVPGHVLEDVSDLRPPIGATHPLRVAEAVTRLGGSPLDDDAVEALEQQLLHLLEPAGAVSRAHEDPDPVRRVARRILQRLDGMGKWGSYHTAFDHLARGFAGNERALAYEVGESLLAAGLLEEKPSVGQRHVYLSPRRSGDIRRLIDDGELPQGLVLPPTPG